MTEAKKGGDLTPAVFTYGDNQQVRAVLKEGEAWVCLRDVRPILGFVGSSASDVIGGDEHTVLPWRSRLGLRSISFISERGLLLLILKAGNAEGMAFGRWVVTMLLPKLRRGEHMRIAPAKEATSGRDLSPKRSKDTVLDLQHLPIGTTPMNGTLVRTIAIEGKTWYLLADVQRSYGVKTAAWNVARSVPAQHRCLVWMYGVSQPAWCINEEGLALRRSSLAYKRAASQKAKR